MGEEPLRGGEKKTNKTFNYIFHFQFFFFLNGNLGGRGTDLLSQSAPGFSFPPK